MSSKKKNEQNADTDNSELVVKINNEGSRVFNLQDGREVIIRRPKGKDIQKAGAMMGGRPELYMASMMHILVTIDGKKLPIEEFGELDGVDYMDIQKEITPFLGRKSALSI